MKREQVIELFQHSDIVRYIHENISYHFVDINKMVGVVNMIKFDRIYQYDL